MWLRSGEVEGRPQERPAIVYGVQEGRHRRRCLSVLAILQSTAISNRGESQRDVRSARKSLYFDLPFVPQTPVRHHHQPLLFHLSILAAVQSYCSHINAILWPFRTRSCSRYVMTSCPCSSLAMFLCSRGLLSCCRRSSRRRPLRSSSWVSCARRLRPRIARLECSSCPRVSWTACQKKQLSMMGSARCKLYRIIAIADYPRLIMATGLSLPPPRTSRRVKPKKQRT